MPSQEQIQEWNKAFSRIKRVEDYTKLKSLKSSIEKQIEELEETVNSFKLPKGPKEEAIQLHDKMTLPMLIKQKDRVTQKLTILEEFIRVDIEESKKEEL